MESEITSSAMQKLLGIGKVARGIAVRGTKRGSYIVETSVQGYCAHLRNEAAARGGEAGQSARERLGNAQATLAETKARQLSGELVEIAESRKR